jgi:hypothetical protein
MSTPFPKGLATTTGQKSSDSSYGFLRKSDDSAYLSTWVDAGVTFLANYTVSVGGVAISSSVTDPQFTVVDGTASHGKFQANVNVSGFGTGASWYGNSSDTQPKLSVTTADTSANLGPGGSSATDWKLSRTGTAAAKIGGAGASIGLYGATPVAQASRVGQLTAASGSASSTISDVGASFNQTTLNNNFKSLATKVNGIEAALSAAGGGIGVTA